MNATAVGLSREYEQQRYTDPYNILRSELIYGDGFQSPGGVAGFRATLADRMPIANGMELLDIGSGLGGAVFDLASRFSVQITGIDTAPVMTQLASKRQSALDPDGHTYFVTGDVYSTELHPDNFDCCIDFGQHRHEALTETKTSVGSALVSHRPHPLLSTELIKL